MNLSITPVTTTGSVTTSICAGGSYTWPANGITYTTAQSGVTVVSGCNTATLNLSITPLTTNGSVTTSICSGGSYTWPANGVTYTTAQTGRVVVTGCNTATLNLTVNSNTTNGTQTVTANNSYTWPLPLGNGQTYTTSGTYTNTTTNTSGCPNIATLALTIITGTSTTYYQDLDGDGYGNGAVTLTGTSTPTGYVTNNTDCNDTVAATNPGVAEILYDGIDNNCNGQLDEGSQLKTTVLASQCGTTLSAVGSLIGAITLSSSYNITGYRFRITNGNSVQTIDRTQPNFSLTSLATYNYSTAYSIDIQLQKSGVWLGYYGDPCVVTTPSATVSAAAPALTASQCGIILVAIGTSISTPTKPGTKGYKFRVTNLRTGFTQERASNKNTFALTDLTQYVYGDTYTVEVAITSGTVYPGYGNVCTVTAPAVPSLTNQCGTIIASKTTSISTASLLKVTSYNFEVTNMTTLVTVSVVRTTNSFTLSLLTNYNASTQFRVRVRLMTTNVYSDYGPACYINSPAIPRDGDAAVAKLFKVSGYPNPFDNDFKLSFDSTSTQDVSIRVFDILGKMLEEQTFKSVDAEEQEIGARLPSGMYLVNVSQGEDNKTLKMIKR